MTMKHAAMIAFLSACGPAPTHVGDPEQPVTTTQPEARETEKQAPAATTTTAPVASSSSVAPSPSASATAQLSASAAPAWDPSARAWAERCAAEMKKGRDEAVKALPSMAEDTVETRQPTSGTPQTIVFLVDDDFAPEAELGPLSDQKTKGHSTWFEKLDAEAHEKGHWWWVREYTGGAGWLTFDHGPEPRVGTRQGVTRAIETMKRAIDRCFAAPLPSR